MWNDLKNAINYSNYMEIAEKNLILLFYGFLYTFITYYVNFL